MVALDKNLSFAPDLIPRIVSELVAGRHVLLVGPAGTGKTTIAEHVIGALGYDAHTATASADWTTFEVVGGFWPAPSGSAGDLKFVFRPGAFVEAVLANWESRDSGEGHDVWTRSGPGCWLLLDELNRADMDRAFGGVFTALENLRLRVPVAAAAEGHAATTEIPIPKDFRIVATMNGVDRHYLFRLSDALKRRFAFVEVPVTMELADEWRKLRAAAGLAQELARDEETLLEDVRRFVYLARLLHPVGSAQLLASLRFLNASRGAGLGLDDRLVHAIAASILPSLEEVSPAVIRVFLEWATTRAAAPLALALKESAKAQRVRPGDPASEGTAFVRLHRALEADPTVLPLEPGTPPGETIEERLAVRLARRTVESPAHDALTALAAQLASLVRDVT
jgi:MoxR-like ATPase